MVPLVLVGPGRVGRALLELLVERHEQVLLRCHVRLETVAVADHSGLVRSDGCALTHDALREIVRRKAAGQALAEWPAGLAGATFDSAIDGPEAEIGGAPPVLVDTSAADTTATLLDARARGWRLVLANKMPLVGPLDAYDAITQGGAGARWESTVASSLPVVAALQTLLDVGDEVRWISGLFSGTMGFVVQALERRERLSDAVRRAIRLGLAEPDPRDDLSGRDVGRKALILARMLGYGLHMEDVALEGLIGPPLERVDLATFLERLPEADEAAAARAAELEGGRLGFLATVGDASAQARLVAVERGSPLGRADPLDSVAVLETACYRQHPLVLQGRGPGPAGAAMGVLGDIVALARASAD